MLIRESAPLCLAEDSGWGEVLRGWAWIAANRTMSGPASGVKVSEEAVKRVPTRNSVLSGPLCGE